MTKACHVPPTSIVILQERNPALAVVTEGVSALLLSVAEKMSSGHAGVRFRLLDLLRTENSTELIIAIDSASDRLSRVDGAASSDPAALFLSTLEFQSQLLRRTACWFVPADGRSFAFSIPITYQEQQIGAVSWLPSQRPEAALTPDSCRED